MNSVSVWFHTCPHCLVASKNQNNLASRVRHLFLGHQPPLLTFTEVCKALFDPGFSFRLPWMSIVPFAVPPLSLSSSHFFHALPGFYPLLLWLPDTTSQLGFLPQVIASDSSGRLTHLSPPSSPCRLISTLFFFFPFAIKCDFYSTDKPLSIAALVGNHMVKTGIFFSRISPPF